MKYKEFLEELFKLYEKYDISIGHEDSQGSFTLEKNCEFNRNWISDSNIIASQDEESEEERTEIMRPSTSRECFNKIREEWGV